MDNAANSFIKTKLPKGGFIGIHLRNGIDWVISLCLNFIILLLAAEGRLYFLRISVTVLKKQIWLKDSSVMKFNCA